MGIIESFSALFRKRPSFSERHEQEEIEYWRDVYGELRAEEIRERRRQEAEDCFYSQVAQASGSEGELGRQELKEMLESIASEKGVRFGWQEKGNGLDGTIAVSNAQDLLETGSLRVEREVVVNTGNGFGPAKHHHSAKQITEVDSSGKVRRGIQVTRNDGLDYHQPGRSTRVEVSSDGFDSRIDVSRPGRVIRFPRPGGLDSAIENGKRIVRTSVPGSSENLEERVEKHLRPLRRRIVKVPDTRVIKRK